MKHKLYIHRIHIAFAFGILILLSGCQSAELKTMESSASTIQLTTGSEISRSLRDKDWGFSGPIYPQVIIVYEPVNGFTKEDVYAEIVAILKKNNWEGGEPIIGDGYFKASLQQGGFEISAGVTIDSDNNHVIVIMTIY